MELIKITPDKERAKNMLKMVALLEERIERQDKARMASLVIVDYYEIIKEITTALLLADGYKTLSHKDLIDYLREKHKEISSHELSIIDDLRILRNRATYEGFLMEPSYLIRNEVFFKSIIKRLKNLLKNKI